MPVIISKIRSGEIQDVLEDMLESFTTNLESTQTTEATAKSNFDALMTAKKDQLSTAKAALGDKSARLQLSHPEMLCDSLGWGPLLRQHYFSHRIFLELFTRFRVTQRLAREKMTRTRRAPRTDEVHGDGCAQHGAPGQQRGEGRAGDPELQRRHLLQGHQVPTRAPRTHAFYGQDKLGRTALQQRSHPGDLPCPHTKP